MPMSSGLSSEGHSSSRAPKAPRSRARLRAQQAPENVQTEVAPAEAVQAKSVQPQVAQPQAAKTVEAAESVKPAASAQPASSGVSASSAATQPSSSVRHMPRKPVVHKASAQHGTDSSASKSCW